MVRGFCKNLGKRGWFGLGGGNGEVVSFGK